MLSSAAVLGDPMEVEAVVAEEERPQNGDTSMKSVQSEEEDDEDEESSTSTGEDDDDSEKDDEEDTEEEDDDDSDDDDDQDSASEPTVLPPKPAASFIQQPKKLAALSPPPNRGHPKMRIKLSLKLPTKKNALAKTKESPDEDESDDSHDAVKATVVASDEEPDASVVAAVVTESNDSKQQPTPVKKKEKATTAGKSRATTARRRSANPSRPIKMPPIHSPGLLMPQRATSTPAALFDQTMTAAGYTHERRTQRPHRGSSVQRVVGDLFDSDVKLSLHFPPLVPTNFWPPAGNNDGGTFVDWPKMLLESLESPPPPPVPDDGMQVDDEDEKNVSTNNRGTRKRPRPLSFRDMVPISLTMQYPADYVEKYMHYVELVQAREKAIVRQQERDDNADDNEQIPPTIPPIPTPPGPPMLSECDDWETNPHSQDTSQHPLYIPRNRSLVAHLDPNAFHITAGRYFGLYSNWIADPNFCGPAAAGGGVQSGGGLATTTSGTSYTSLTLGSAMFAAAGSGELNNTSNKEPLYMAMSTGSLLTAEDDDTQRKQVAGELPQLDASERDRLVSTAVRAARSGRHEASSFVTKDGTKHIDVCRVFSECAGIRPCARCHQNKQGVRCVVVSTRPWCRLGLLLMFFSFVCFHRHIIVV